VEDSIQAKRSGQALGRGSGVCFQPQGLKLASSWCIVADPEVGVMWITLGPVGRSLRRDHSNVIIAMNLHNEALQWIR